MTVWKKLAVPVAGVIFVVLGGVKSADAAIFADFPKEPNDTFAQANPLPFSLMCEEGNTHRFLESFYQHLAERLGG